MESLIQFAAGGVLLGLGVLLGGAIALAGKEKNSGVSKDQDRESER